MFQHSPNMAEALVRWSGKCIWLLTFSTISAKNYHIPMYSKITTTGTGSAKNMACMPRYFSYLTFLLLGNGNAKIKRRDWLQENNFGTDCLVFIIIMWLVQLTLPFLSASSIIGSCQINAERSDIIFNFLEPSLMWSDWSVVPVPWQRGHTGSKTYVIPATLSRNCHAWTLWRQIRKCEMACCTLQLCPATRLHDKIAGLTLH